MMNNLISLANKTTLNLKSFFVAKGKSIFLSNSLHILSVVYEHDNVSTMISSYNIPIAYNKPPHDNENPMVSNGHSNG